MRTPAGALVGLAVLLLLVAVVWIGVWVIQHRPARSGPTWRDRVRVRMDRKARAAARWQPYRVCQPGTGSWLIGVELMTKNGDRLDWARMAYHPSTATEEELLEADAEALIRAGNLNRSREERI